MNWAEKTNQGFVIALITLVLFLMLVTLAVNLRTDRSKVSSWSQDMIVTRKLLYTTDDVAEDVRYALGARVLRSGDTLVIYDHLPANFSMNQSLTGYSEFVRTRYLAAEMEVKFYDELGNEIELNEISPTIIIYPYNITYAYEDYGKRELSLDCQDDCTNDLIQRVDLEFNLTDSNFSWIPAPGNESHYAWAPNFLYNNTCPGNTCVNFSLLVRDSRGYVYTCPGPICPYNQFRTDFKSQMHVEMAPCWLQVTYGSSDDNVFLVRLHEPGNPNQPCQSDVDMETSLNFPSGNYYLNLPGSVRVTDRNYNSTRIFRLPGENISARELGSGQEPTDQNESECFLPDGSNVWAGGSGNRYVYGVRLSNSCTGKMLTITKMRVTWSPASTERIEVVNINATSYWVYNGAGLPDGRQPSGTLLDMVDYSMNPLTTTNITYFRFASGNNMRGKLFTIDFTMGDGSGENFTFYAP